MKLMKRGNDTVYAPDCFISAYKALGYSVVGEEEPSPTASVLEEPEQTFEEASVETSEVTSTEEIQEVPEQDVPGKTKDAEYVCPICGKTYSRQGNLDKHIKKEH